MKMMSRPSIADLAIKAECNPKLETRPLKETGTTRTLDEEDNKTGGQPGEEDLDLEVTQTRMANTATIANSKDINRRNARKETVKTIPAGTPKDDCTGRRFTK
jgi:hypothetical protein